MLQNNATDVGQLKILGKFVSDDGTERYVWQTCDGGRVETVFVFLEYRRISPVICVSSQIGCKVGCCFCRTGRFFNRNLQASEIVEQVTGVLKKRFDVCSRKQQPFQVSYMSMGEPLLNWQEVRRSIDLLTAMFRGKVSVAISTVGIVPGIHDLVQSTFVDKVDLQISLHAPDDEIRKNLVPLQEYSVEEIVRACDMFAKRVGRPVCANYVMLRGVNDSIKQARKLATLLDPEHFYVKLSRLNKNSSGFVGSSEAVLSQFERELWQYGLATKRFISRGTAIGAGCGQIAANPKNQKRACLESKSTEKLCDAGQSFRSTVPLWESAVEAQMPYS